MDTGIITYSPEWFAVRQGQFTASDAWRLMVEPRTKQAKENNELSETTNTYVLEKVWEALSGLSAVNIDNAATQWGVEQEPNAKKWYTKITGIDIKACGLFEVAGIPLLATPDGLVGNDGLIEVKCPYNGAIHLKHCFIESQDYFKENHREYYWQIQCQLLITERYWCDFVSFDPRIESNLGMFIFRVKRDNDDIEMLIEKSKQAKSVYENYLKLFKQEKN